jgi:hypothetical protein
LLWWMRCAEGGHAKPKKKRDDTPVRAGLRACVIENCPAIRAAVCRRDVDRHRLVELAAETEKPAEAGLSILWPEDKVQGLVNG